MHYLVLFLLIMICFSLYGQTTVPPERYQEGSRAYHLLAKEHETIKKQMGNLVDVIEEQVIPYKGDFIIAIYWASSGKHLLFYKVSAKGKVLWKNLNPFEFVTGYNYQPRIAVDDKGQIALISYGTEARGVHLRMFDRFGHKLWTTQVADIPFSSDNEEDVVYTNLLYWKGYGWLTAFSTTKRTVAQLISSKGEPLWQKDGMMLAPDQRYTSISIAIDTRNSAIFVWYDLKYASNGDKCHYWVQCLGVDGKPKWKEPIKNPIALAMNSLREIKLEILKGSKVKATLLKGVSSDIQQRLTEYPIIISSDGKVEEIKK